MAALWTSARASAARAVGALAVAVIGLGALAGSALAQSYPNQLVRIVVPFSPGSQTDILGRAYAEKLAERWKRDVIVENKPGLAGTTFVAKAPADGYNLLLISNGHALIESLNQNLSFDPVKDFVGITRLAVIPGILVVNPEAGPKSLKELVDKAKQNPGKLNYASAGLGSASSIGVELLKTHAGIDLVHIPYRGLPEAHTSVMRNDALVFMTFFSASGDLIQGQKLRPVAVTTTKRHSLLPDVPTVQEAGVSGYVYDPWFGLLAPAGTPKEIVDKISQDIGEIAKLPDIRDRFTKLGVDLATSRPEEFGALVKSDTERFTKIFGKAKH